MYLILGIPYLFLILEWNGIVPPKTQEANINTATNFSRCFLDLVPGIGITCSPLDNNHAIDNAAELTFNSFANALKSCGFLSIKYKFIHGSHRANNNTFANNGKRFVCTSRDRSSPSNCII